MSCGSVAPPSVMPPLIKTTTGIMIANPMPDRITKASYSGKNIMNNATGEGEATWYDAENNIVMTYRGEFSRGMMQGNGGRSTYPELKCRFDGFWAYGSPYQGAFDSDAKSPLADRSNPFDKKPEYIAFDAAEIIGTPVGYDAMQLLRVIDMPAIAIANSLRDSFTMWVLVDQNGRQVEYRMNEFPEGLNPNFALSAVAALKKIQCSPAKNKEGKRIPSWISIPFSFDPRK